MSTRGLDFSDGAQPPLDAHPDLNYDADAPQPAHLQRNKTERRRLQGLQRTNTSASKPVTPYQPKTLKEKWDLWMINEGGKRLFFSVWVFLHLLVAVFGFLNYDLKDNLTGARATFGITYRTSLLPHCHSPLPQQLISIPQPSPVLLPLSSILTSSSSSSPSAAISSPSSVAHLSIRSSPLTRTSPSTRPQLGLSSSSQPFTLEPTWSTLSNSRSPTPMQRQAVPSLSSS